MAFDNDDFIRSINKGNSDPVGLLGFMRKQSNRATDDDMIRAMGLAGASGGEAAIITSNFSTRVLTDSGAFEASSCLMNQVTRLRSLGFYDQASLIITPNGVKANKIYSLVPTSGSGDFTFARVGTRTRVDSSGVIVNVATGVPALEYSDSICPYISLSPQRTNLLLRSAEFNNASWVKSNITVTADTQVSPDGTANGDTCDVTNATNSVYQDVTVSASTVYTLSWYAKRGTGTSLNYRIFNNTGAADIVASTNYYSSLNSSSYTRVIVTFTTPVGCTSARIYLSNDSGVGTFFPWGAQIEAGPYETTYTATVGASATRVADTISTLTGATALIGQTEGTLYAEFQAYADSTTKGVFAISDGTSANWVSLQLTSTNLITCNMLNGGITQASISNGGFTSLTRYSVAITYGANYAALFVNGVKINQDLTVTVPALDRIAFNRGDGNFTFFGRGHLFAVSKTRISDVEAIDLTTI